MWQLKEGYTDFAQKSRSRLKVLGAERVARSKVRIEDSQY